MAGSYINKNLWNVTVKRIHRTGGIWSEDKELEEYLLIIAETAEIATRKAKRFARSRKWRTASVIKVTWQGTIDA